MAARLEALTVVSADGGLYSPGCTWFARRFTTRDQELLYIPTRIDYVQFGEMMWKLGIQGWLQY